MADLLRLRISLQRDLVQGLAPGAGRVGLAGTDAPFDARHLPDEADGLDDLVESTTVFGRVGPEQKQTMVRSLQGRGHTVSMTGDGVNDVLALKEADLGVAMGSGAAVSRTVAPVVLLDSDFGGLPPVLAEGRRVIANVERVANLFVTKTVYATLLALSVGVLHVPFPFLPRHLTIVSSLTIGIPAFFLALAPNEKRAVPGFVERVLPGSILRELGFDVTWRTYAMPHAVCPEEIRDLGEISMGQPDVLALPESYHLGGWLGLGMLAGGAVLLYRLAVRTGGSA